MGEFFHPLSAQRPTPFCPIGTHCRSIGDIDASDEHQTEVKQKKTGHGTPQRDPLSGCELLDDLTASDFAVCRAQEARSTRHCFVDRSYPRVRPFPDIAAPENSVARTGMREDHAARRPLLHGAESDVDRACDAGCRI